MLEAKKFAESEKRGLTSGQRGAIMKLRSVREADWGPIKARRSGLDRERKHSKISEHSPKADASGIGLVLTSLHLVN